MSSKPEQPQHQPQERKIHLTSADLLGVLQEGGREKLKELLAQMDDDEEIVVDSHLWEQMTEAERAEYFWELSLSKKTFIWKGVRCVYDSNPGPISMSFGGPSAKLQK